MHSGPQLAMIIATVLAVCVGCLQKNERKNHNFKSFIIGNVDSHYSLRFNFPQSFVSIKQMDRFEHLDTTNIGLNWIFNVQYENPHLDCFYDSLDPRLNVIINAGPRVDISNKSRRKIYFTVPTVSLDRVFPPASDSVKIIEDAGKKTYKDKTYFKRTYKGTSEGSPTSTYYFISTKWHSALVIVNSPRAVEIDEYILDYETHPKD